MQLDKQDKYILLLILSMTVVGAFMTGYGISQL